MSKTTYKITVYKGEFRAPTLRNWQDSYAMWRGKCSCNRTWQFHFFGATLGYGLEHLRRHNG